jgi:hypothetical protein
VFDQRRDGTRLGRVEVDPRGDAERTEDGDGLERGQDLRVGLAFIEMPGMAPAIEVTSGGNLGWAHTPGRAGGPE